MEGEGEKALVNSASEIEDKGKKRPCEDSASVSAASGRKDLERACDARVKAYREVKVGVFNPDGTPFYPAPGSEI
ncbi:hypothetical protein E3N88_00225 [Mikania micrantha]|uniref:Uncharacterized protein n=1 Tax=Mikania micrantha TaxID=192012 RepID=A0A5N6PXI1_9ASTR|nr:hypothetical protein E3N88_00225 [Mikania micrantha]